MKRFYLAAFCMLLSLASFGQQLPIPGSTESGIRFLQGMSWSKILTLAKKEHKLIFVDCYATWCVPCKQMDRDIYPLEQVGEIYNNNYICVRLQMDSTAKDQEDIKKEYKDVQMVTAMYRITAYPTFLFLDSDGRLLDKAVGSMEKQGFMDLGTYIINAEKDYYQLLSKYKAGNLNLSGVKKLAEASFRLNYPNVAADAGSFYISKLKFPESLNNDNIQFIYEVTSKTDDPGFKIFKDYSDTIDKIRGDDVFAQTVTSGLVIHETVAPLMHHFNDSTVTEPDWTDLEKRIAGKYGQYQAARAVMHAKIYWAFCHKKWKEWASYYILFEDTYGTKTNSDLFAMSHLNNSALMLFNNSDDTTALQKALVWSARSILIDPNPELFDTYGNILYKLGKIKLAIEWQTIAAQLEPNAADIRNNLIKMKIGEPTWTAHD